MGMDIYSKAFIGLKIHKEDVFTRRTVQSYPHDYPRHFKLDPITGKELWKTVREMNPGFTDSMYGDAQLGDYQVVALDYEKEDYVVALLSVETGSHRGGKPVAFKKNLPDAEAINIFREKLQELGLWDDSNFGLWVSSHIG